MKHKKIMESALYIHIVLIRARPSSKKKVYDDVARPMRWMWTEWAKPFNNCRAFFSPIIYQDWKIKYAENGEKSPSQ